MDNEKLDQLKKVIMGAPEFFGAARKEEMLREAEALTAAGDDEIEEKIIVFGKEIYPARSAHLKLYRKYVKGGEETAIRAELPEGLKERFDKFLVDLGDVEKLAELDLAETDLTEPDRETLFAAEQKVHAEVHKKCSELIRGEKGQEFEAAVKDAYDELKVMEEKVSELRHLAEANPDFGSEILSKARHFELDIATDRGVIPGDIQEEIDFYSGIATGEAA